MKRAKDSRTYQDRKAYQLAYQRKWRLANRKSIRRTTRKRSDKIAERRWRHKEYNRRAAFKTFQAFFEYYEDFRDQRVYIVDEKSLANPSFCLVINGRRSVERLYEPLPTW